MAPRWANCLVRVRYCGYDVSLLLSYKIELCSPSYHRLSVRFLNSAVMACYYILQLFPVYACPISLHMYFVIRVCWFVCSSLMLRIFGMQSLKIGYRILNCIMNLRSFIFGFYFSFGIPQLLFKIIFVAVIVLSTHSYLELVCVGCNCARFLFVGMVQQTLRKLGRCQMTRLI